VKSVKPLLGLIGAEGIRKPAKSTPIVIPVPAEHAIHMAAQICAGYLPVPAEPERSRLRLSLVDMFYSGAFKDRFQAYLARQPESMRENIMRGLLGGNWIALMKF